MKPKKRAWFPFDLATYFALPIIIFAISLLSGWALVIFNWFVRWTHGTLN